MRTAVADTGNLEAGTDSAPATNPEGRAEGRNGRGRGRGGRRDERGPRTDDANHSEVTDSQQAQLGFTEPEIDGRAAPQESAEPREKRSRDRYGRERGPRADRPDRSDPATQAPGESLGGGSEAQVQVPPARTAPTEVTPETSMPKVQPFSLPLESLLQVAQNSGLQWVNSDAQRVAAVQAAIAAEPDAIFIPRERPAPVVVSELPLILVETKKDLRNMTLPFESAASN
jgi:ribonuclease E